MLLTYVMKHLLLVISCCTTPPVEWTNGNRINSHDHGETHSYHANIYIRNHGDSIHMLLCKHICTSPWWCTIVWKKISIKTLLLGGVQRQNQTHKIILPLNKQRGWNVFYRHARKFVQWKGWLKLEGIPSRFKSLLSSSIHHKRRLSWRFSTSTILSQYTHVQVLVDY